MSGRKASRPESATPVRTARRPRHRWCRTCRRRLACEQGDDVIILPSVSDEAARETYPDGWQRAKHGRRIRARLSGRLSGRLAFLEYRGQVPGGLSYIVTVRRGRVHHTYATPTTAPDDRYLCTPPRPIEFPPRIRRDGGRLPATASTRPTAEPLVLPRHDGTALVPRAGARWLRDVGSSRDRAVPTTGHADRSRGRVDSARSDDAGLRAPARLARGHRR